MFEHITNNLDKWDRRFIELAMHISTWSKDPSTKVGAVIVRPDRTIAATGYNGFARGIKDKKEWLENREIKLKLTLHAEENAILSSKDPSLNGYTVYTYPLMPCAHCANHLIQSGIVRVVALSKDVSRWKQDFELTKSLFNEAGIMLEVHQMS